MSMTNPILAVEIPNKTSEVSVELKTRGTLSAIMRVHSANKTLELQCFHKCVYFFAHSSDVKTKPVNHVLYLNLNST